MFCHVILLQDQECGDQILITVKSSIYSTKPRDTCHLCKSALVFILNGARTDSGLNAPLMP
ncbi:hypothetical protein FS594_02275 [Rahnella aquatilis]|nr:hypothetical protein FS594_02275 [Rahnella aquatilis]